MTLQQLAKRKSLTVLGINSGTSADGIDLALVRLTALGKATLIAGRKLSYSSQVRELVLCAADSTNIKIDQIVHLDNLLGQLFGQAAQRFIASQERKGIRVDAVASHGQTVRHLPQKIRLAGHRVHGTLQLGSLDQIARLTGKVVIGDFRQADVALGNEGAPITVAAVGQLLGSRMESRVILNIGGMANYFYFPRGQMARAEAADSGPGNVLSDLLTQRLFRKNYDKNGALAKAGQPSHRLLTLLASDRTLAPATRSTGREQFGAALCDRIIAEGHKLHLSAPDLLATATELTVSRICRHLEPIIRKDRSLRKLYLTGGGAYNSFLRRRLQEALPTIEVTTVAALGMNPGLLEAASYAVMGNACLKSIPLRTLFYPGAKQNLRPILGRIAQPPISVKQGS